jgi:hypothetical protein
MADTTIYLPTRPGSDADVVAFKLHDNGDGTYSLTTSGGGGGTQYAEDAAHVSGDTGTLALVVRKDTAAALAGTDGDYAAFEVDANGRLHVILSGNLPAAAALADAASNPTTALVGASLLGYNGATWDRVRVQSLRKDVSTVAIGTIATVWTPTSGKKFRLMGGSISVSAAASVLFEDNSAGAGNFIWRTPKLAADTPYNFDLGNGFLSAAANQVLKATASTTANLIGTLYGVEE